MTELTGIDRELAIMTGEVQQPPEGENQKLTIEELRGIVDECDDTILRAVAVRFAAVESIGDQKLQQGLPVGDISRESQILRERKERAIELGLNPAIVDALWPELFREGRASQELRRKLGRPALDVSSPNTQ